MAWVNKIDGTGSLIRLCSPTPFCDASDNVNACVHEYSRRAFFSVTAVPAASTNSPMWTPAE